MLSGFELYPRWVPLLLRRDHVLFNLFKQNLAPRNHLSKILSEKSYKVATA